MDAFIFFLRPAHRETIWVIEIRFAADLIFYFIFIVIQRERGGGERSRFSQKEGDRNKIATTIRESGRIELRHWLPKRTRTNARRGNTHTQREKVKPATETFFQIWIKQGKFAFRPTCIFPQDEGP